MKIFNSITLKGREYIKQYDDYVAWYFRDKRVTLPAYNIHRNLDNYAITYVGVGIKDKSKNYLKIETYKNKKLYNENCINKYTLLWKNNFSKRIS